MDMKRRELFLRVIDGDARVVDVMFQFDKFVHCERMLEYLVKERITGAKFFEIYIQNFRASWLQFGQWLVMKINNDTQLRPIIGGKDYRLK